MLAYMCLCVLLTFPSCFAGQLPKELGKLAKLTFFNICENSIEGELYMCRRTTYVMHITEFPCAFAQ